MPTQKQIDKAIEDCIWRKDVGGVSVCGGMLGPCIRIIEKCQCPTLTELYQEEKKDKGRSDRSAE